MFRITTLALALTGIALTGAARADFVYGGRAYASFAPGVVDPQADTGSLPPGGGVLTAHLDNFNFMNLVTSGALDAQTMGVGGVASSDASVAKFHADLRALNANFVADADLISSHSQANGMPLSVNGTAAFVNLVVNGMALSPSAPPNTMVSLGTVGFIVLNEQTSSVTATDGNIAVNGVHIHLTGLGVDIFLAHTESSISNQQTPVPEPGTWMLLGIGTLALVGIHGFRRRRPRQ
jgi:hypothetical protein